VVFWAAAEVTRLVAQVDTVKAPFDLCHANLDDWLWNWLQQRPGQALSTRQTWNLNLQTRGARATKKYIRNPWENGAFIQLLAAQAAISLPAHLSTATTLQLCQEIPLLLAETTRPV